MRMGLGKELGKITVLCRGILEGYVRRNEGPKTVRLT